MSNKQMKGTANSGTKSSGAKIMKSRKGTRVRATGKRVPNGPGYTMPKMH